MGYSKPQVTIDLEEYQYLLKIKEDGHDDAAIKVINQILDYRKNFTTYSVQEVMKIAISQTCFDTIFDETGNLVKISNRK